MSTLAASEILTETLNDPGAALYPQALRYYRVEVHRFQEHIIKANFIDFKIFFNDKEIQQRDPDFITNLLLETFENVIHVLSSGSPPDSYLRMVISSVKDDTITPISIPFVALDSFSARVVMDKVSDILNSADFMDMANLKIHLVLQKGSRKGGSYGAPHAPRLGRFFNRKVRNIETYLNKRRCLIAIRNRDNLCGAKALLLGESLCEGRVARFRAYLKGPFEVPTIEAWKLHREVGLPLGEMGLFELDVYQKSRRFKKFQINVFTLNADKGVNVAFSGPPSDKKIDLLLENDHFWVIKNVRQFYNSKYFCYSCFTAYNSDRHKCPRSQCQICRKLNCANVKMRIPSQNILCQACRCIFATPECAIAHQDSDCKNYFRCEKCGKKLHVRNKEKHDLEQCGLYYCKICSKFQTPDHEFCFLQTYERKNPFRKQFNSLLGRESFEGEMDEGNDVGGEAKQLDVWGFDIESDISQPQHRPNLLVTIKMDESQRMIFRGYDCCKQFIDWLFDYKTPHNVSRIFIAHNLGSYDGFLLLKELYSLKNPPGTSCFIYRYRRRLASLIQN